MAFMSLRVTMSAFFTATRRESSGVSPKLSTMDLGSSNISKNLFLLT